MSRKKKPRSYTQGEEIVVTFTTDTVTYNRVKEEAIRAGEDVDEHLHNRLNATLAFPPLFEEIEQILDKKLALSERVALQVLWAEDEIQRLKGAPVDDDCMIRCLGLDPREVEQLHRLRSPSDLSASEFIRSLLALANRGNVTRNKLVQTLGREVSGLEYVGLIDTLITQHIKDLPQPLGENE